MRRTLVFILLVASEIPACVIPDGPGMSPPSAVEAQTSQATFDSPQRPSPAIPPPPEVATVTIVGALIGPAKIDGTLWDGPGHRIDPAVLEQTARALAASHPYAAAAAIIAGLSLGAVDKPDPVGDAELLSAGSRAVSLELALVRDSYTPQWNATFRHMPLDGSIRIRVTLRDKDLVNDDPIGVAEIDAAEVRTALEARDVYQVPVADQTNNQLLFVGISAISESPSLLAR